MSAFQLKSSLLIKKVSLHVVGSNDISSILANGLSKGHILAGMCMYTYRPRAQLQPRANSGYRNEDLMYHFIVVLTTQYVAASCPPFRIKIDAVISKQFICGS